ncbi:MAG: glucosyltransferase domain-containing protein [Proteobacteria bacterium]|nr:glucosyltransferase domain-containing protein [Pseudomonadota bacterium]
MSGSSLWAARGLTPKQGLLTALCLYLVVTGWGVLNDGYHSDDWRHLTGASPLWTAVEGRWLLDLIYRDILGQRFLPPVQAALAFPCFYWVAWTLAGRVADEAGRPLAAVLIFAIGVNHPYMSDVLSFGSNVFAYPLAMALSVAAFDLIERNGGQPVPRQMAAATLAAVLLSLSVSIYQTFAIAGLIVPALALMRADRVSFAAAVRLALIGAAVSLAAIMLYLVEWRLYAGLRSITIDALRFQAAGLEGMAEKLAALPFMVRRLQTGSLMELPFGLRALLGCLSLAALLLAALAAVRMLAGGLPGGRLLGPLRVGLAAGLILFVFPVFFWIGYEGDNAPARAFGYFGFWVTSLVIAGITMAWPQRALRNLGFTALALSGLSVALTAAVFWSDTRRIGARDVELARAVYSRLVNLPGYSGGPFRLVGGVADPDTSWGGLASWSSFHGGNPSIGIFRELYRLPDYTASLPASPKACPAFPADGSAFMHDGIAYVCLEAFDALTDSLRCAPLAETTDQTICLGPKIMVHVGPTCLVTGDADPALSVAFQNEGRSFAAEWNFSVENFPVDLGPVCATLALAPDSPKLETLKVTLRAPDGTPLWKQEIPASALVPNTLP